MGKNYFQFKEFKIEQDQCANKVSTDACVFGAWLNKELKQQSILDIGCGTGLLSLMLAQGNSNELTGIELDAQCAEQAQENISKSPWTNQITLIQTDIRKWRAKQSYDALVCNPPFFNNTSLSHDAKRNLARQNATLGPNDWKHILRQKELQDSCLYFLLSNNEVLIAYEEVLASIGFSNQRKIILLDHQKASCKRVILIAAQSPITSPSESIIYKNPDGSYTEQFTQLLRPFYLYL